MHPYIFEEAIKYLKSNNSKKDLAEMYADYGHIAFWNTKQVNTMHGAFRDQTGFNQPIGLWDTSNVTDMSSAFFGCTSFNQPIGSWDTSNVTNMGSMFFECESFNQPIGSWVVKNVKNMNGMFFGCVKFNQPIGSWVVDNAQNINFMFHNCTSFNQELKWELHKLIDKDTMLESLGFKMPYMALPMADNNSLVLSTAHDDSEIQRQVKAVIEWALALLPNKLVYNQLLQRNSSYDSDQQMVFIIEGCKGEWSRDLFNNKNALKWGGLKKGHRLQEAAFNKYVDFFTSDKIWNNINNNNSKNTLKQKILSELTFQNPQAKFNNLLKRITYATTIRSMFGFHDNEICNGLLNQFKKLNKPSKQALKSIQRYCDKTKYQNALKGYIAKKDTISLAYDNYRKLYNNNPDTSNGLRNKILNHYGNKVPLGLLEKFKKTLRRWNVLKRSNFNEAIHKKKKIN
jgi:surface protein